MGIRCWINQTLKNIVKPIPSTYIHTYISHSLEYLEGRRYKRKEGREGEREEVRKEWEEGREEGG